MATISHNVKFGKLVSFSFLCHICKTLFTKEYREFIVPLKVFCSRSCANTRVHSENSKQKIRYTLSVSRPKNPPHQKICETCTSSFASKHKVARFCGVKCAVNHPARKAAQSIIGRKSAQTQAESRRSKNEAMFGELCKLHFERVSFNDPMFNGWDADVVIHDHKIAALWNGNWHYKKLTEKHSVAQVQNRDRIKIKEIIKCGYFPYIIKDEGRHNPKFVNAQFDLFVAFAKTNF